MHRTVTRLADGRKLMYFDEQDGQVRDAADTRVLPPPPAASQLRYDPLVDEWVAVAAHRQGRTFLPPSDECPLCPSTPGRATEIPARDYDVVVFENRFPSFSDRVPGDERPDGTGTVRPGGTGTAGAPDPSWPTPLTPVRPGQGRCEVVCFTPEHSASFATLSPGRVRTVLDALADRTAELARQPGVAEVFCFENRGEEIGVTLHHPHGQIYAYPFVTPRTRTMLAAARRYADRTGGNLYADVLAAEVRAGTRVVGRNAYWTAYVPAAARWPFEVHLAPSRRVGTLPSLTGAEADAFGPLYLDILRRFDALFDVPMPYIAGWYQAPVRHPDRDLAHLHLRLFSIRRARQKLKYLAGSESAMGVFINDIPPEQAARLLRDAH